MHRIYSLPDSVSLTGKRPLGYRVEPLKQKDLGISYVEVDKRRDTLMISKELQISIDYI
jgi:hypothetical protein